MNHENVLQPRSSPTGHTAATWCLRQSSVRHIHFIICYLGTSSSFYPQATGNLWIWTGPLDWRRLTLYHHNVSFPSPTHSRGVASPPRQPSHIIQLTTSGTPFLTESVGAGLYFCKALMCYWKRSSGDWLMGPSIFLNIITFIYLKCNQMTTETSEDNHRETKNKQEE